MLPLCSRSRPSAPSSPSEWQCVRGCSDAMRNFLGRVPAPPPSARASLKRAHALWMPAHVSCAIANRRVKVCWHRWKSAACVRWLVALLRHRCSSVCTFLAGPLQVIHGRSSRHGWQTRARPRNRLPFGLASSVRRRDLVILPPSEPIHDALYREGVVGGCWPVAAATCALTITCVAITAGTER